ncbi:LPS translocon maturation chaperone LptM [Candidatus Photodesmus blepharus]
MKKILSLLSILSILTIEGCGQTGPLYTPKDTLQTTENPKLYNLQP